MRIRGSPGGKVHGRDSKFWKSRNADDVVAELDGNIRLRLRSFSVCVFLLLHVHKLLCVHAVFSYVSIKITASYSQCGSSKLGAGSLLASAALSHHILTDFFTHLTVIVSSCLNHSKTRLEPQKIWITFKKSIIKHKSV